MPRLYLIELSYRTLKFLDFLNISLNNWKSVPSIGPKNEKYTLSQRQYLFRMSNDNNLVKYQNNETKNENHPQKINYEKEEFMRNWASLNKINSSKELPLEEISELNCKLKKYMSINLIN